MVEEVFQFCEQYSETLIFILIFYGLINILVLILIHEAESGTSQLRWNLPEEYRDVICRVDIELTAWCNGRGPTILFLRSVGGSSAHFAFLFKRLSAKGYRVIAYDMRGHGFSKLTTKGRELISASNLVDDLKYVISFYQCEGVTIVGYGLGGYVAQNLFLQHPKFAADKVGRLILLSSFSVAPCTLLENVFLSFVSSGVLHFLCQSKSLSRLIGNNIFGTVANGTLLEDWRRSVLNTSPRIWKQYADSVKTDLRHRKAQLPVPTLIVCGDRDIFYSRCQRLHFAHLKTNSERIWLERVGHMTPWEAPDSLTKILCNFVPRFETPTVAETKEQAKAK